MSSSALPPGAAGCSSLVSTGTSVGGGASVPGVGACGVAVVGVVARAEELDAVGDDVDGGALVVFFVGPLAPLEAAVDGDRPALGEEPGAVLALGAPDGDREVVGLVGPLAGGAVLAAGVDRDPQRADA